MRILLLAVAVAVAGGLALAVGLPGAGAKGYSAYHDPQKPVLSFLLSDQRNVRALQREFGLGDERVAKILAVVREERGTLAEEYEESERIVEANEGVRATRIEKKISASDFDEKVRRAVANTRSEVKDLLPKGRAHDLGPWVDERWQAETADFQASSETAYQTSSTGFSCRVWASYYGRNTWNWVALPHWRMAYSGDKRVRITDVQKGTSAGAPVEDTGPWNTKDNYWRSGENRTMWKDLPRCVPESQAAFFDNYNGGKDQFGREVLNPAAIDITPRVARRMEVWEKIQFRGLIKVRVRFLWVQG